MGRGDSSRTMKIALIGDSHSQVLWKILSSALRTAGHEVVLSIANPGWSEARYVAEGGLAAKLSAAAPDLVIYELGGNNQHLDPATYRQDATALVAAAQGVGAAVLWFGPPSVDSSKAADTSRRHEATADMQTTLIPGLGARWVDDRPVTRNSLNHQSDGVHFTSTGYQAWAKAMLPEILKGGSGGSFLTSPVAKWSFVGAGVSLLLALMWRFSRR